MTAASAYVGIPFRIFGRDRDGIDCYGLVRLVLAEQYGVTIPDMWYRTADDITEGFAHERAQSYWQPVAPKQALPGDVVVFRVARWPIHCGIMVTPSTFLHAMPGNTHSVIESLRSALWQRRILGMYRHEEIAP